MLLSYIYVYKYIHAVAQEYLCRGVYDCRENVSVCVPPSPNPSVPLIA